MKTVYFISGLGADSRSFGFLDLSFCDVRFVQWINPAYNETLVSYAERMFESINDENATIVGMSFGGMLATEMAKRHPNLKVIVIASAKTHLEIPAYLRVWRHFPLYKLHTQRIKNYSAGFVLKILGAKGVEQKKVQQQIMKDHDPAFIRWASGAIVNWNNTIVPTNVVHIHGSADKLLPYRYVKADYTINKGEHVMVLDQAEEVSVLLKMLIAG
jgi:pimeloyl-ACP methyl ester carboxylesterase